MSEMSMQGGWTMPMVWMHVPGQGWPGAMLAFLGTWTPMMLAMMLPSALPALRLYLRSVAASPVHPGRLTLLAAAAYFLVWIAVGAAVFPVGVALAAAELRAPGLARVMPVAAGVVVLIAAMLQFTAWKTHHLDRCRGLAVPARSLSANAGAASRYGLRLGLHCACSSAGPMAVLFATGLMDLRTMAAVAAAITLERLAPSGERVARAIGFVFAAVGFLLIVRQLGLG